MYKLITFLMLWIISQLVWASNPSPIKFQFRCPKASHHTANTLIKSATTIQGYGKEFIMDEQTANDPFFSVVITSNANLPDDITKGGYNWAGTSYDSSIGKFDCHYESSLGFDAFTVSFISSDLKGGRLMSSSSSQILIDKFYGIRK